MNSMWDYRKVLLVVLLVLAVVGCGVGVFLGAGAGLALWLTSRSDAKPIAAAPEATRIWLTVTVTPLAATPEPTEALTLSMPTATQTPTVTGSPTATLTPTVAPTVTVSATATVRAEPTAALPTQTATVTLTPVPAFAFILGEADAFPTGKDDLDLFVAVTDADNNPLDGYRILGIHSGGQGLESQPSVARWSENSGAMHYKAGNIKVHVEHSPAGSWAITLVDQANQVVAAPLDLASDPAAPQWYFLLFRLVDVEG